MSEATVKRYHRIGIAGILVCGFIGMSLALGFFASFGQYVLDADWYAYAVVGLALLAVVMTLGNTERFLAVILIVTLPLGIYFKLVSRRDFELLISSWDLAAWGLMALVALRSLVYGTVEMPKIYVRYALPLLGFIAASALSVGVAGDRTSAVFATYVLFRCLILYMAILAFVKGPDDIRFILDLIILMLLAYGAKYIAENFLGFSIDFVGRTERHHAGAVGTFRAGNPNDTGGDLACLCALALSRLLVEKRVMWRAVTTVSLVTGLVALVLTQSRGSWLSFAIAVSVIMLIGSAKGYLRVGTMIAIVCIALVICGAVGNIAKARLTNDDKGTAMSRMPLMKQALYMIRSDSKNMVFGVGAGNYAFEMDKYVPPGLGNFWRYRVHNVYLLVWAECGTIGFVMFLWWLLMYGRGATGNLTDVSVGCRHLGFMFLGFFAALLPHMFFEPGNLQHVSGRLLAITYGLLAISKRPRMAASAAPEGRKNDRPQANAPESPRVATSRARPTVILSIMLAISATTGAGAAETRIILRMDDSGYGRHARDEGGACLSDAQITERVIGIVTKHGAKVTIGVIPNTVSGCPGYSSPDPQYAPLTSCPAEIQVLRAGIATGHVEIALHGWSHEVMTINDGHSSEFGGLSYEEQADRLARGKSELEKCLGVRIAVFVPPFNNHDRATLRALKGGGFEAISSAARVSDDIEGLSYVPRTTSLRDLMEKPLPFDSSDEPALINAVFHVYDFVEGGLDSAWLSLDDFDAFLAEMRDHQDVAFTSIAEEVGRGRRDYGGDNCRLYALYGHRLNRAADLLGLLGPAGGELEARLPSVQVLYSPDCMRRTTRLLAVFEFFTIIGCFGIVWAAIELATKRIPRGGRWLRPGFGALMGLSGLCAVLLCLEGVFGVLRSPGFGIRLVLVLACSLAMLLATGRFLSMHDGGASR